MESPDRLIRALNELDDLLSSLSLQLKIVICGAYAIQLHGFTRNLYTQDIDSLTRLDSPMILEAIQQIGKKLGLGSRWLNDQASTVSIPDGTLERAKPLDRWKAIQASLIDRSDLVKMKVSAFSIRREETTKDWEDLELLKPTKQELDAAIDFLRLTNSPPPNASRKLKYEFEETINDLKKLLK